MAGTLQQHPSPFPGSSIVSVSRQPGVCQVISVQSVGRSLWPLRKKGSLKTPTSCHVDTHILSTEPHIGFPEAFGFASSPSLSISSTLLNSHCQAPDLCPLALSFLETFWWSLLNNEWLIKMSLLLYSNFLLKEGSLSHMGRKAAAFEQGAAWRSW